MRARLEHDPRENHRLAGLVLDRWRRDTGRSRIMTTQPRLRNIPFIMLLALVLCEALPTPADGGAAPSGKSATRPPPFAAQFRATPLRRPLIFKAGFGDYRGGHFHAAVDLGTGRRVGRPALAPESSCTERARSSSVEYCRAF